jgi:hypothetical protein
MIEIDLDDFRIPDSLIDAKNRLVLLSADIEAINIQLDSSDKKGDAHNRWRVRASDARRMKRAEVQWIQNWISQYNASGALSPEDMKAGGLLLASLPILNTAAESGLVDDGNQVILDAVRGYIKSRFPAVGGLITGTTSLEEVNAA